MKKPIIIIVHGWSYSLAKWEAFLAAIQQKNFEVMALNVPGLTAETDRVWTMVDFDEWLGQEIDRITQQFPNRELVLLGHSNGGRIIVHYLESLASKSNFKPTPQISKLILIDSAGVIHQDPKSKFKRFVFRIIAKVGKKLSSSPQLRKILYQLAREQDYYQATPQLRQTMANLITSDVTSHLDKLQLPTLLIWGENDKSTPLSDGQFFHRRISESQLVIIPDARHSPQFTHVEKVAETVISFLESNP